MNKIDNHTEKIDSLDLVVLMEDDDGQTRGHSKIMKSIFEGHQKVVFHTQL